jgi:glutathione S-transferase
MAATLMLVFYHAPGSSSMAVHIALHEIGAPFDGRLISLRQRDRDPPEFRSLNPEGKVPTLLIDGRVLTEVAAILYYLARQYPGASLFPAGDIEAEAQVISWMSFVAATIHPARRQSTEHAQAVYRLADQRLAGRTWACETYSIADIHLFRLFWRFRGLLGLDPASLPNLNAHYHRMMQRPAVQKTLEAEAALGYDLPA